MAMFAILAIAPLIIYPVVLMKVLCFAIFAAAFNLLIGYVGLLSFGHALFFGFASYVSAYSLKNMGITPELAIISGTAIAAVLGLITGLIAIRRQGIYFAMITLAIAQMMYLFALQAPFTGGEDGIQAVPRGYFFGLIDLNNMWNLYFFVLAIFSGSFLAIFRIVHSPFGEVLRAIRENETRAESLGFDVNRYKLGAFVISAAFAGVAGSTKAIVFQLASLADVHWSMSGEVVLMTLVGGMGTMLGPVAGAFVVVAMQNYLASTGHWVTVIQGLIFMSCVMIFRRGIVGEIEARIRK